MSEIGVIWPILSDVEYKTGTERGQAIIQD